MELHGETAKFVEQAEDAIIAVSNYRLHIKFKESLVNVSGRNMWARGCVCHVSWNCLPFSSSKFTQVLLETFVDHQVVRRFHMECGRRL